MEIAWGWWTLAVRTHPSSSISDISYQVADGWSLENDDDAYKYIQDSLTFWATFSNVSDFSTRKTFLVYLYATYTTWKNIDIAVKQTSIYNPNDPSPNVKICEDVIWVSGIQSDCSNLPWLNMTWYDGVGWSNLANRQSMYFYKELFQ